MAVSACAGSSGTEGVKPVNTTPENVAIRGFDTVEYFTANAPAAGNPEFAFVWNGAKWLFSSADNLERFKADPSRFAPQFGGYCSWAVSHGYTADGDPMAWKVVDGKLYLNYNLKVKEKWEAEQENLIKEGERNWTAFRRKKPEHK
ncbi:MAG: YHS domain protein [Acidobacteria bacterium]|nr:YHS domain protein [Acidobacteriota bacterium]